MAKSQIAPPEYIEHLSRHINQRAQERLGITLTRETRLYLKALVQSGERRNINYSQHSKRCIYQVVTSRQLKELYPKLPKYLFVVYDNQLKRIITILEESQVDVPPEDAPSLTQPDRELTRREKANINKKRAAQHLPPLYYKNSNRAAQKREP